MRTCVARVDGVSGKESIFKTVTVQKSPNEFLAQNSDVKTQVTNARLDILPFNCGNTYEKYEQAYYQNFRFKSTFTESMSIIVYEFTGVNLLDTVEVMIGHDGSGRRATCSAPSLFEGIAQPL
jgi:hypothetical protein